jgi:four helix bundle protein
MEIFEITKAFPGEERFSLTDQIRRSSRSVAANLAEAWRKRRYPKVFVSKLVDAAGEAGETEVWLDIARDAKYLPVERHGYLRSGYDEVGRMLYAMSVKPDNFILRTIKKEEENV